MEMYNLKKEAVELLDNILSSRMGEDIEVTLVDSKWGHSRDEFIYKEKDIPEFLKQNEVLKIDFMGRIKKLRLSPYHMCVTGVINKQRARDLINSLTKELIPTSVLDRSFCKFENDSFFIRLNDGSWGSINFTDKRGSKDMLTLFELCFNYWKELGEQIDGWIVVKITKNKIKERLTEKGITDSWIKDTISNIRNTKIKPSKLDGYIAFDYFDRKTQTYPFRIKRP